MKNPFKNLNKTDLLIFLPSLLAVILTSVIWEVNLLNLISTIVGVTMLVFMAKGHVFGLILSFIFAVFYAIKSYGLAYYGEVVICFCLMIPMSIFSIVSWMRNPYKKGETVVKIRKLPLVEKVVCIVLTFVVTITFYFILCAMKTASVEVSTISIFTSFWASFLLIRRSAYYAIVYMLNDLVLITLWTIACFNDISNLSVVVCFSVFLINDLYGFIQWKKRSKTQGLN